MKETEIDESEECSVELNKSVHYTKINFSGNLEGKGGRREGEGREKGGRKWKECSLSFKCFTFCGNWCGVSHVIVCPSIST